MRGAARLHVLLGTLTSLRRIMEDIGHGEDEDEDPESPVSHHQFPQASQKNATEGRACYSKTHL